MNIAKRRTFNTSVAHAPVGALMQNKVGALAPKRASIVFYGIARVQSGLLDFYSEISKLLIPENLYNTQYF